MYFFLLFFLHYRVVLVRKLNSCLSCLIHQGYLKEERKQFFYLYRPFSSCMGVFIYSSFIWTIFTVLRHAISMNEDHFLHRRGLVAAVVVLAFRAASLKLSQASNH
jgi:hypothetical protein